MTGIDLTDRDRWIGRSVVARLLGVSEGWVGRLAAEGRLPFQETNAGRLYDRLAVEQVRAERAAQAAEREA